MKRRVSKLLTLALVIIVAFSFAVGCKDKNTEATYTYNVALSVFPTNWNPHQYQTDTDSTILDYTTNGFYEFDYNENKDGYKLIPVLATDFPIDITSEYVGKEWGIKEGDKARAYKIPLNKDAKWEDGTPITADSYINSAKLLLNPVAQNYRADTLYSGSFVLFNAKDYVYQDAAHNIPVSEVMEREDYETLDELFEKFGDQPGYINWKYSFGDTWSNGAWTGSSENKIVDSGMTIRELKEFFVTKGVEKLKRNAEILLGYYYDEAYINYTFPKMSFDKVGIKKDSNGDLVVILEKPLSGFYLHYNLSSTWLVHEATYLANEKVENGVYTNSYGTNVETYKSYGPYKLSYFKADSEIKFTRNENWFGYSDEAYEGLYQTTDINIRFVENQSTRLEMFLNGQLDTYTLSANDMETYGRSEHVYFTKGPSTFYIALNPDFNALQSSQQPGKNKTILTLTEFRQALSFALDRTAFCAATSPTNTAAFGMFSDLIISDPDNGTAYRSTEEAKDALISFWGLKDEIGEGKKYKNKDEAIASITGYDLAGAKKLFNAAYDNAIEQNLMKSTDVIEITIGTPNATSNFYNKGYEFLVNCYTEAVKGTKLEGKLTFTRDSTLGDGYGDALRNNQVDMLFGVGWNGAALDPYYLMTAYTDPNYQYDDSFDTKTAMLSIDIDGDLVQMSVYDWSVNVLMGVPVNGKVVDAEGNLTGEIKEVVAGTDADSSLRLKIFAALEEKLLTQYNLIPLMDDSTAALKGMQIQYYTEDYIYGVGRGGVKYMTYNYSDQEWSKFVKKQGGTLNYT